MIIEQIAYKQRFFIPSEPERGIEILTAVLKRYPAINADGNDAEESAETLEAILEAHITGSNFDSESEIVDIDALVIEPEPDASYSPVSLVTF